MRRALTAIATLLAVVLAAPARGESTPWAKVWRSEEVARRISAAGRAETMIVLDGSEARALAQVHADAGKLRLDYEAAHRVWSLIDDGERLIRLDPGRKRALVIPRPAFALDQDLAERNYVARVFGDTPAPVAGRLTEMVEIVPRGGGGRIWRLWLDTETGFALKRERYAISGRRIMGTEYLEIEFNVPAPSGLFAVPEGWETVGPDERRQSLSLEELSRRVGFEVLSPRALPAGYVPWGRYVSRGRRGLGTMAELRYTDGLRVLSVFQRKRRSDLPGPGDGPPPGRPGRGRGGRGPGPGRGHGRSGFGPPTPGTMNVVDQGGQKALRYFGKNRVILVVGDLTVEELLRVAKSTR